LAKIDGLAAPIVDLGVAEPPFVMLSKYITQASKAYVTWFFNQKINFHAPNVMKDYAT
jgi:hypothetical protein